MIEAHLEGLDNDDVNYEAYQPLLPLPMKERECV
jgi:hypothetical protein